MHVNAFCVFLVTYCLIALERGSSGESICRPSHFYMKSLEGYNGRYWFRTSGLFDEVGDRRGIPLGPRFQSPPPEPDGRVSTHPALRRADLGDKPSLVRHRALHAPLCGGVSPCIAFVGWALLGANQ